MAPSGTSAPRLGLLLAALAGTIVVGVGAVVVAGGLAGRSGSGAHAAPRFVEEAMRAGVEHAYAGDWPYVVGGGVAAFDCDADRRPDLFVAGGSQPAALFRNRSPVGGPLAFERIPSATTDLPDVTGAYPLDVDGDGLADLAVLRNGENVLLRGTGDCRFERANEAWGIDGGDDLTVAFSATWEGDMTLPTLAFGNYVEDRLDPANLCADSALLRPDETGDRYAPPIALSPGHCALSALFSDWARNGGRDLRLSNDRHYYREGEEQLWRIVPGETPRLYTREEGWAHMQIWGMGIASRDVTGDGRPEVYLTSQGDNKLQALADGAARPTYRDIAVERGVTATRPYAGGDVLPSTAWHPEFDDVNNDGWVDLLVTKGNVDAEPGFATRDPTNLFLGRPDGGWVEGAPDAGIVTFAPTRGAAVVDLDLDGLNDIVLVHRRENVSIWRNVGGGAGDAPAPMGHWAAVALAQPAPNVDAIGAWIDLRIGDRVTSQEVTVGGGHAGGQLGWIHLGLGDAQAAEVRVTWPDGEVGPWLRLEADGFALIERGAPAVTRWSPGS